jgi:hypothetical protein
MNFSGIGRIIPLRSTSELLKRSDRRARPGTGEVDPDAPLSFNQLRALFQANAKPNDAIGLQLFGGTASAQSAMLDRNMSLRTQQLALMPARSPTASPHSSPEHSPHTDEPVDHGALAPPHALVAASPAAAPVGFYTAAPAPAPAGPRPFTPMPRILPASAMESACKSPSPVATSVETPSSVVITTDAPTGAEEFEERAFALLKKRTRIRGKKRVVDASTAADGDSAPPMKRPASSLVHALKRPAAGKPYGLPYPPTYESLGCPRPSVSKADVTSSTWHKTGSKAYHGGKKAAQLAGYAEADQKAFAKVVYADAKVQWGLLTRVTKKPSGIDLD